MATEREHLLALAAACDVELAAIRNVNTVHAKADRAKLVADAAAYRARAAELAVPVPTPTPDPVPTPTPTPVPDPPGTYTEIVGPASGMGTVLTVTDAVRSWLRVSRPPSWRPVTDTDPTGIVMQGHCALRHVIVDNSGHGLAAYAGDDVVLVEDFDIVNAGGAPNHNGEGLYPIYGQGDWTLRRGRIRTPQTGARSNYSLHGYGRNTALFRLVAEDLVDEHPGTWLVCGEQVPVQEVRFTRVTKQAGPLQLGIGNVAANGVVVGRDSVIPRLKLDGKAWKEVDLANVRILEPGGVERWGDTISSGQRTWDGFERVVIDGRLVHQE